MTIRLLRLIAFLGIFLLVSGSVAVTFVALQTQHTDALVINLAGRQRMLIQRMTLEVLGTQIGANRVYREDLHNTAHAYFEATLTALINGGPAIYTDGVTVTLPSTRSPQILAQLESVRVNWEEMHAAIHAVLDNDPQSPAFMEAVNKIERLSPLMLRQMDEAVQLYESESAGNVAWVQFIQFGFLATASALLLVAFILSERWVLAPITRLGSAARRMGEGDLTTPIAIIGPGELSWLAHSFDDMRQKLCASREQSAERLERISSLHDIDVAITSRLSLQERLDILLEKVVERLRVDAVAVALIDSRTRELVYVARRGLNGDFFQDGSIKVGEGIVGQVAQSDQPMVISDVRAEPRFVQQAAAERFGIVSYIAVPLRARGETIGVLEMATREPHLFPQEEVDFFITLAGQAAIALENARLFEEARQRAAQRGALAESAGAMLSRLDEESLWPAVAASARGTLLADRVAIFLYDSSSDSIACPYSDGLSTDYIGELIRRFREVPGGRLLADPRPIAIADTQTDPATAPIRDSMIREGFRSYAVFPLTAPESPLGALVAYRNHGAPFTKDDLDAGQTLAYIVAVAMLNARLFESERAQLKLSRALEEMGALLTSQLSLNEVLETILDLLARVVKYDSVSIQLIDEESRLNLTAGRGFPDIEQAALAAREMSSHSLERKWAERKALVISDTHTDDRWIIAPGVEYIRSWVGAPLLIGDRLIGTLNVDNRTRNAYDAAIGVTVMAFANQAAIAIENARLFESEREQRELADVLRDAGTSLSATLDFDSVLDRLLEHVGRVVPYDTANIMLLDAQGHIRVTRQRGYEQFGDQVVHDIADLSFEIATTPNLRRMVETGQPFVVPDTTTYPDWVRVAASAHVRSWAGVPITAQGQVIAFFSLDKIEPNFYQPKHIERLAAFAGQAALALQNAQLFKSLVNEKRRIELLYHLSQNLAASLDPREVAEQSLNLTSRALGAFKGELFVLEKDGIRLRLIAVSGYAAESVDALDQRLDLHIGQGLMGYAARTRSVVVVADTACDEYWETVTGLDDDVRSAAAIPLLAGDALVGVLNLLGDRVGLFLKTDLSLLTAIATPVAMALQNAKLFDETQRRAAELKILTEVSSSLRQAQTHQSMLPLLVEKAMEAVSADAGALILLEGESLVFAAARGPAEVLLGQRHPRDDDPLWQVVNSGQPIFISDVGERREFFRWEISQAMMTGLKACACVPLKTAVTTIGLLHLACRSKRVPTESEVRLLTSIAEMAGNALHRATLHEQTKQQLQRLTALHVIDTAISASFDLRLTLNVLLEQITTQLHVDAADILLLNPRMQTLEYANGRGFQSKAIERSHLRLGEGYAGQAALERRIIHVPDLRVRQTNLLRSPLFGAERFVSTFCIPLIAKGQVKGVLEIFHRAPLESGEEWLNFLESLAAQVAIAIDNAELFEGMQRSNAELALAYDATIEGWSQAMDLRDKETEGHSQRVTEATLSLAQAMGLEGDALLQIRRGALLHDIGKMGIPDSILLKNGPLTDEEWAIMRQHPDHAYHMLKGIAYLRHALDIPYCHHEKWDGTGYPRGLKGEGIPLAARIFAVIDVWDALRSDRPYRKGWTEEKAQAYIREQSGQHFDPKVVEIFLRRISAVGEVQ